MCFHLKHTCPVLQLCSVSECHFTYLLKIKNISSESPNRLASNTPLVQGSNLLQTSFFVNVSFVEGFYKQSW